jgi:hypothetical protein
MRKNVPAEPTELRRYSISLQQTAAALFDAVGQQGGRESLGRPDAVDKKRDGRPGQMG